MSRLLIIAAAVHIAVCAVAYILAKTGVFRSSQLSLPLALLVPLWGPLCLAVSEIRCRIEPEATREADVEKMLSNDEIHRSILMDEDDISDSVVPLEEALIVNDASTRRGLIMDVMYANPGDYVSQLQAARMNDDTEVVHYAVTALVELQKEYELELQRLEREVALASDDDANVNELISLYERYLSSGLLDGNARNVQLRNYSALLAKKLETSESCALLSKKAKADLHVGEYADAFESAERMVKNWSRDERGYLALINCYALLKDRAGIDRVIEALKKENVYLTPSGRSEVRFWTEGGTAVSAEAGS